MFERNLFLGIEPRVFDDAFGGCWMWVHELDKKIGCGRILLF
jgi:hypothetical protein